MSVKDKFFSPAAGAFQFDAVYALGVLAELSYTGSLSLMQAWADNMGFTEFDVVQTPGVLLPNFCWAKEEDEVVLCIPGTVNGGQMMDNIFYSGYRENADFGAGRIHSFFLWAAEGIADYVKTHLALPGTPLKICLVGHSLGGAVAQLLADYIELSTPHDVAYVCTFNAPRVGDSVWASRTRQHIAHLHYCSHDLVCEMPPAPNLSLIVGPSETHSGIFYVHRDELVRIESLRNIDESWLAVSVTKATEIGHNFSARLPVQLSASSFMHHAVRIGRICGFASWLLPAPIWWDEHKMSTVLTNLTLTPGFQYPIQQGPLQTIRDAIPGGASTWTTVPGRGIGILPPANFAMGEYPGGGGLADLPVIPTATRTEIIEAVCEWITAPAYQPTVELISVADEFFDALMREQAANPTVNPLTSTTPLAGNFPVRYHWHFRGQDRRLLETFWECLEAIEARDTIAATGQRSAALSTRETMFADADDELREAFYAVKDQVNFQLGLFRE